MNLKKLLKQVSKKKLLLAFVILNLILNVIGADFGLPSLWHPDELTHTVTRMLTTKTLNPGRFIYPSFYYYTLFFLNVPYSIYLLITGKTALLMSDQSLKEVVISNVFLTSRIFTAFIGSLSIIMIYLIAKKISNERAAIISAGFGSVTMAIITYSHFATTDIPVTFMSLLSLYLILRLYEKPTTVNYILSGMSIGLATGTKYYAALLVILLSFAHVLVNKKLVVNKSIFLAGISCVLAFFISTPFAILDFQSFYRDTSVLQRTTMLVDNLYDPFPAFSYIFHLDNGLGTPLFILSLFGIAYCATIAMKNRKIMLVILWGVIYYGLISYRIHFSYLRYILPVVPILLIASGIFSDYILSIKNIKKPTTVLLICIFLYTFSYAIKTDALFLNDSRYSSTDWVNENIPKNSKILLFVSNNRYIPDLSEYNESLYYLNASTIKNFDSIKNSLENIAPDYIIDSSLYYDRYLRFTNMYPRRSPLVKLVGYKTHEPGITEFYTKLFDGELGYILIKKIPEEKEDVPDPEFINPTIVIFKRD